MQELRENYEPEGASDQNEGTTAAKHSAMSLFCDNGFKSRRRKYRNWTTT
jgi:hypothetical protein